MPRKYYDITITMKPGMTVYPGDPQFEAAEHMCMEKGDVCNVSVISFGSHTGTHMDAPKHFYKDGLTVDKLPLEHFLGPTRVVEIRNKPEISACDLENLSIRKGERILFKTDNSFSKKEAGFNENYVHITPDAAQFLADKGVITVGIDYLSVEGYRNEVPQTHYTLLGNNIAILEGLRLDDIMPGEYELIALPLKIENGNGSPVRAILVQDIV